ncbi:MAG: hypothetical protein V1717_03165 [Candidatus Micrarchaeota archaeon]
MLLDAPTFKTVLTPEAALGMIQKTVASKGWKQYDVSDVKMVYTPYWVFSFDVVAGEASPTGKTALNAYSGELNDYIPYVIERPLKKMKETEEGFEAEVLPTSVSKNELSDVAATKVAAHAGIKKDMVAISAPTKFYVPSYQIWVDVAGDSFKIDVDALLGNPFGAEAIPERPKGWSEAAGETVEKMKKPSGWIELFGKALGSLSGMAKPGGGGGNAQAPWLKYALLGVIVLALAYFVFFRAQGGGQGSVTCDLFSRYYHPAEWLGLGAKPVKPRVLPEGMLSVEGQCSFSNPGKEDIASIIALARINVDGVAIAQNSSFVGLWPPTGKTPTIKTFEIVWPGSNRQKYSFSFCRLEDCR